MTSFQSKTGRDRPIKREKTNSRSDQFLLDLEYKFPKKKAKKLTKLKNINTASFQDKTGRDKQRTGEKKISFRSIPTQLGIENSKKK